MLSFLSGIALAVPLPSPAACAGTLRRSDERDDDDGSDGWDGQTRPETRRSQQVRQRGFAPGLKRPSARCPQGAGALSGPDPDHVTRRSFAPYRAWHPGD